MNITKEQVIETSQALASLASLGAKIDDGVLEGAFTAFLLEPPTTRWDSTSPWGLNGGIDLNVLSEVMQGDVALINQIGDTVFSLLHWAAEKRLTDDAARTAYGWQLGRFLVAASFIVVARQKGVGDRQMPELRDLVVRSMR